jgi:hypothetical protein
VAFVRPGFLWTSGHNYDALFPTVLMFGYSNLPEDFDARVADFYSFVESVDWFESELADVRESVLGCTTEEMVRITTAPAARTSEGDRTRPVILSPDVLPQELQCLREHVQSPVGISFAARRAPFEVPVAAATATPPVETSTTTSVETPTAPQVETPVSPPVEAPVSAPVEAPVSAPVEAPTTTVEPPVTPPAETPVVAPTETPAASPAAFPQP